MAGSAPPPGMTATGSNTSGSRPHRKPTAFTAACSPRSRIRTDPARIPLNTGNLYIRTVRPEPPCVGYRICVLRRWWVINDKPPPRRLNPPILLQQKRVRICLVEPNDGVMPRPRTRRVVHRAQKNAQNISVMLVRAQAGKIQER